MRATRVMPGGRNSLCMGCGGGISDQYILRVAPDMEWHAACLKCAECHQFLDERCTCFVREGKTYCKKDYSRLFGAKCEKCSLGFTSSNMVMRAKNKIFHVQCFKCTLCEKRLEPGDEFALRNENLYCRQDYDQLKDIIADDDIVDANHNSSSICNVQLAEEPELHSEEASSRPSTADSSQCRVSRDIRSPSSDIAVSVDKRRVVSVALSRKESGRIHKSEGKPTRVRTVLTEKQLHTLRTCYNANPRPDALMKEQLVEMTGLSPRVIRVWFQNKRCKDKKRAIYMKQTLVHSEKNGRYGLYGSMQGIPLVASSPSHQEPPGIPYEVTTIQPPWKSIAEYALQHELERLEPNTPQYQQFLQQMHGYGMDHDLSNQNRSHQSPMYYSLDESGEESNRAPLGSVRTTMCSPFMAFARAPSVLSSASSD